MHECNGFEILAISCGDNLQREVTFLYRNKVIGKTPLQPPQLSRGVRMHLIDHAWHNLLASDKFQVPNTLPDELQVALAVCASEYKNNVHYKDLTYKFTFPTRSPLLWNLRANVQVPA